MEHPAGPQARICPRARPNNALQLPRLSLLLQNFSFPRVGVRGVRFWEVGEDDQPLSGTCGPIYVTDLDLLPPVCDPL